MELGPAVIRLTRATRAEGRPAEDTQLEAAEDRWREHWVADGRRRGHRAAEGTRQAAWGKPWRVRRAAGDTVRVGQGLVVGRPLEELEKRRAGPGMLSGAACDSEACPARKSRFQQLRCGPIYAPVEARGKVSSGVSFDL
jgi:hypothetical protein